MRIHKVLIIADPSSSHTKRWANLLASANCEVLVFGLPEYERDGYINSVRVRTLGMSRSFFMQDGSGAKIAYLQALPKLLQFIREFNPDVLHAQYASSNGLLGALTHFHPFYVSVWGTDIYDFPRKSFFHKKLIEFNLKAADKILSTSRAMAEETAKYTPKEITTTPFGIDMRSFYPPPLGNSKEVLVIGTIKRLHRKYGIDNLIRAFAEVLNKVSNLNLKLIVAGSGEEEESLKNLTRELGISSYVEFPGYISLAEVPSFFRKLDVAVFLSHRESYGVAVLEASASGVPVVVTNIGGLPEVVENGRTGFVVPDHDHSAVVESLLKLIHNSDLRQRMGLEGREFVLNNYSDSICNQRMLQIYGI